MKAPISQHSVRFFDLNEEVMLFVLLALESRFENHKHFGFHKSSKTVNRVRACRLLFGESTHLTVLWMALVDCRVRMRLSAGTLGYSLPSLIYGWRMGALGCIIGKREIFSGFLACGEFTNCSPLNTSNRVRESICVARW